MKVCSQCKMRYPNEATVCFVEGGELMPLPDPRIGTLIAGLYQVEEVIGEGGMATVYGATQKLTGRPLALKIMNPILATDVVVRERFRREAKNSQKLAHPNIIEIFNQGDTEDGTAYIAMERLSGESLADVIARGPIEIDKAIGFMLQIARGIARAHDLEVIHRDLKPENIFVCRREEGGEVVKLLDFGIARSRHDARLTNQGELFGTPQYMAPERITGKDAGAHSDLYALGVIFFEMLTGELPFNAPDIATFFVKHMSETPKPVSALNAKVPLAVDLLVASLLEKDPKNRPVDAHRVRGVLEELAVQRNVREAPTTIEPPPPSHDAEPDTMTGGAGDPWMKRVGVFEQMLTEVYGVRTKAPRELTETLDGVRSFIERIAKLRQTGLEEQYKLEEIDHRGREGRQTRGHAVEQLGVDASRAREALRELGDSEKNAAQEAENAGAALRAVMPEIMRWEGRSGFQEPYAELAAAYRSAAEAVEAWLKLREEQRRLEKTRKEAEWQVADIEQQIKDLRENIAAFEQSLETERQECEQKIVKSGQDSSALEQQLIELTSRFTTPLRTLPELERLFKDLEGVSAA